MKNQLLKKTKFALSALVLSSVVLYSGIPRVFAATTPSLTKAQFLQMFLQSVNVKPDSHGKSSYSDLSSKSNYWGYVHKALELGIVIPDSKTRFGVSDSVSQLFASQIAIKYYHMNIVKESPGEWAQSQGLISGLSKEFTLQDGTTFLQRLKTLSVSLNSFANSWTLLPGETSELNQAFQYLNVVANGQVNSTMSDSMSFNFTTAGKKNKALVQSLERIEGSPINLFQSQDSQGTVNNVNAAIVTTMITTPDPTAQGESTQTVTNVAYGNTLYENKGEGSGWTSNTDSNAILDSEQLVPLFGPSAFEDVTVNNPHQSNIYTAELTPDTASQFYSAFLYGTVPGKDFKNTLTINVSNMNAQPIVAEEDLHTTVTLSPSLFSQLLGLGSALDFEKGVSSVVITFVSKAKFNYNNAQLTLPNGLTIPGWTPQTGSDGGNGTGTSTN